MSGGGPRRREGGREGFVSFSSLKCEIIMATLGRTERSLVVVFILVGLMVHREARPSSNGKTPGEGSYGISSPGLVSTDMGEMSITQPTPLASRVVDELDEEEEEEEEEGGIEEGEAKQEEEEEDEVQEEEQGEDTGEVDLPVSSINEYMAETHITDPKQSDHKVPTNKFLQTLSTSSGESELLQGGYLPTIPEKVTLIKRQASHRPAKTSSGDQSNQHKPPYYLLDESDLASSLDPSDPGSGLGLNTEESSSGLIPDSSGQMDYASSGLPPQSQVEPHVVDTKHIQVGANPRKSPDTLAFNEVEKSGGVLPTTARTATRNMPSAHAPSGPTLSSDFPLGSGNQNEDEFLYRVEKTTTLFSDAPSSVIKRDEKDVDEDDDNDDVEGDLLENGDLHDTQLMDDIGLLIKEEDRSLSTPTSTSATGLQIQPETHQSAPHPTASLLPVENRSHHDNEKNDDDDVLTSESMTLSGEPIISRQDRGAEEEGEEGAEREGADDFDLDDKLNQESRNRSGFIMGDMPAKPQRLQNSSKSSQEPDNNDEGTSSSEAAHSSENTGSDVTLLGQASRRDDVRRRRRTLHIGGLFELSDTIGAQNGRSELAAAEMAVRHINQQDVVSGYTLKLVHNDTKVSPTYDMTTFYSPGDVVPHDWFKWYEKWSGPQLVKYRTFCLALCFSESKVGRF